MTLPIIKKLLFLVINFTEATCMLDIFHILNALNIQRAKKNVSDSLGLVDFAVGLVDSVLNYLLEGHMKFFWQKSEKIQIVEIL